jgi:lipoprotein-releasing system permease protein
MSRLPFELFLAFRYLRPRRTFVSVITLISIVGVMLGVAVLIVVISVMSGFDQEWRNRILGFNAHLKLSQRGEALSNYEQVLKAVATNQHVVGVAPFIRAQVLLQTQPPEGESPKVVAPVLLGIDPESEKKVSVLHTNVVNGKFDVEGNGILVGRDFAFGMDLVVGDRVGIYSPAQIKKLQQVVENSKRGVENKEAFLADEYEVKGIFDVGFPEYNSTIVVVSLENAQRLYNFDEETVHGLQIMLTDPFLADTTRARLTSLVGPAYNVITWKEETPHLFNALAVEKNMMFFLLFFIMIVAAFGIVNCQITFVVQKTREIGILKALGATNTQVLWIFLGQSVVVGVLGVGLGFGLALLAVSYRNEFLALMRQVTGFELLPSSIYHVYNLPASVQPDDVIIICTTAFLSCVLAGLFPAWKASRLQPVEALRHD